MSENSKEKKGIKAQKMKHHISTQAIDALIGEEKLNGKLKKERKEINKEWVPNPATLKYLVTFYDPHESYGGAILKSLPPNGKYIE